jgi:hypothetical protein
MVNSKRFQSLLGSFPSTPCVMPITAWCIRMVLLDIIERRHGYTRVLNWPALSALNNAVYGWLQILSSICPEQPAWCALRCYRYIANHPPPPPQAQLGITHMYVSKVHGICVARRGRKRFIASWGLRMSHICHCTPCPSPSQGRGQRSKVVILPTSGITPIRSGLLAFCVSVPGCKCTEQPITQDNAPPSILNNRVIVYYTRSNAPLFWYKFNRKPRANLGQFYSVHTVTYYWTFPAALRQIERELFRIFTTRGLCKGTACCCIVSEILEGFFLIYKFSAIIFFLIL